jgi:hypothetical protein
MRDLNFSVNLQLEIIDMLHFIIIALFVLLLLSVVCWLLVYRQFDPKSMKAHPWYKLHQVQTSSGIGCPDRFYDHIAHNADCVVERSG